MTDTMMEKNNKNTGRQLFSIRMQKLWAIPIVPI